MSDKLGFVAVGVAIGILLGSLFGWGVSNHYKQRAIEHGAAYYDSVTGDFEWGVAGEPEEDTK